MTPSLARLLAEANRLAQPVIDRGADSTTHLVYIDAWQRFAALKLHRREFLDDAGAVRGFAEQVEGIQARYAGGIAYPFHGGQENGRFCLLHSLLPGYDLAGLIQHRGPLDAAAVFALGKAIARRLQFVRDSYGLLPSLRPESVWIHRAGPGRWTIAFSDYDLRAPLPASKNPALEAAAVRDLAALLHLLGSGARCADPKPGLPLPPFDPAQPATIAAFLQQLDEAAGAVPHALPDFDPPPIPPPLLHWMPPLSRLTDRFVLRHPLSGIDLPCSFAGWDVLEDHACHVHILPPCDPSRPQLGAFLQQCVTLAHRPDTAEFCRVDSAMSDPSCCVVSEPPPEGLSLREVMERRERLSLAECVCILEALGDACGRAARKGWRVPVLEPHNVLLRPAGTWTGSAQAWWEDFVDPARFQVSLRAFPTGQLFTEAPDLTAIQGGKGAARARVSRNYFNPAFSAVTLAHRLVGCALPGEHWPRPLAAVFRHAFSSSEPVSLTGLAARLGRAARAVQCTEPALRQPQAETAAGGTPAWRRCFSFTGIGTPLPAYPESNAPQTA